MESNKPRGMLPQGEEKRVYQLGPGTDVPENPSPEDPPKQRPTGARKLIKVINMPIVLLLLTAGLGGYIGTRFQDRSFRKNTLFEAQLNQVIAGRNESVRMLQDLDTELKRLSATEEAAQTDADYCKPPFFEPIVERLKLFHTRSMALEDYAAAVGERSEVNSSLESFRVQLANLLVCQNNYLQANPTCTPCTDQHTNLRDSARAVIKAHNILVTELIRKNN